MKVIFTGKFLAHTALKSVIDLGYTVFEEGQLSYLKIPVEVTSITSFLDDLQDKLITGLVDFKLNTHNIIVSASVEGWVLQTIYEED